MYSITKRELISHPLIQASLKELGISARKIKLDATVRAEDAASIRKKFISHPAVVQAMKELGISSRRVQIDPIAHDCPRGEAYFDPPRIVIWLDGCDSLEEVLWVTLHEIRHLWQYQNTELFQTIENCERKVLQAFSKAHSITKRRAMAKYHDMLPSEVDANVYATSRLGKDYSAEAIRQAQST